MRLPSTISRGALLQPARDTQMQFSRETSSGNAAFVADPSSNSIQVFNPKTKLLIATIRGLSDPEGLAANVLGGTAHLYESDFGSQTIRHYTAPYRRAPQILSDARFFPLGLYLDAHGDLWVANYCGGSLGSCLSAGNVVEYKSGSTTPVALVGGPKNPRNITSDASGNIWASGFEQAPFNPVIGYWTGGTGSFKRVNISLVFPGGMEFDKAGNLLIDDREGAPDGASIINLYPHGVTIPSRTIVVQTNGDDVPSFVLDAKNSLLYAPQFQSGATQIISYPAGKLLGTLPTSGTPNSVATIPRAIP